MAATAEYPRPSPSLTNPLLLVSSKTRSNLTSTTLTSHTGSSTRLTSHTGSSTQLTSHTGSSTRLTSHTGSSTRLTSHTGSSTQLTSHTGSSTQLTSHTGPSTRLTSHTSSSTRLTSHTSSSTRLTSHTGSSTRLTSHTGSSTRLTNHTGPSTQLTSHTGSSTRLTSHTGGLTTGSTSKSSTAKMNGTGEGSTTCMKSTSTLSAMARGRAPPHKSNLVQTNSSLVSSPPLLSSKAQDSKLTSGVETKASLLMFGSHGTTTSTGGPTTSSLLKPTGALTSLTSRILAPVSTHQSKPTLTSEPPQSGAYRPSLLTSTSLTGSSSLTSTLKSISHVQPIFKPSVSKPTSFLLSTSAKPKIGEPGVFSSSTLTSRTLLTSKPAASGKGYSSQTVTKSPKAAERVTSTIPMTVKPITTNTEGAPQYDFSAKRPPEGPEGPKFLPPELDPSVQPPPAPAVDVVGLKTTLINSVATSLLCSPDFRDSHDVTRRSLCRLGEKLSRCDPEFILKVALYTRSNLNIRTTANFLLALASNIQSCRPYLKKYYSSSVRLPSDWIEVAEIYQAFHDKSINFGSLPTALRKVMAVRFTEFDAYQLAKYNKDTSKKKKKQKGKEGDEKKKKKKPSSESTAKSSDKEQEGDSSNSEDDSDSESDSVVVSEAESEEEIERLSFTLKQLIRKIHISEPVEHVMCLVGKKYPEDAESFRRSRLPGTWDQERAGKRMKLPVPETWETQVSTKGNKASTWEELIDHQKLPFMAMLRNLRNLIIAGVSPKHHQWVIRKLNDERAVINSRQFPFRFFSAYKVLDDLEKGVPPPTFTKGRPKGRSRQKKTKELPKVDPQILHRYRSALDNALKIATCYNVKPISGSTLILCNVGSNMDRPCTAARGLGKPRTVQEIGILLGLMCKYSCEECTMLLYGENNSYTKVELQEGTILHNMESVMTAATSQGLTSNEGCIPANFLYSMLVDRVAIDNLVLLTDAMKLDDEQGRGMMDFLKKYRHLVNRNLLFVSVDLSGKSSGLNSTIKPEHENDIYLAGYSEQILQFIAERGDSGQLTYVNNIDKAYNLKPLKLPALLGDSSTQPVTLGPEKALMASTQQQRWRTVRVFISSTFRDMHGERDLLTRFVFPELRARAHARQIQVYEVDLRWGVTEEAARSHKALEICLGEISRCQYFLGLLGQRYGWVQDEYFVPDGPEFDWLQEFPAGRSITEIEMQHAALCDPEKVVGKAFFYFRDPFCLTTIPEKFRKDFESGLQETEESIEHLKSRIRTSGLEVYDGYPARWLGMVEEKAMLGGLEDFGQRVLHNLWNAIQKDFPEEEVGGDLISLATSLHEAFIESRANSFTGRRALLKQMQSYVEAKEKLVVVAGKPGSGKSAFMAAFAQNYLEHHGNTSPGCVLSHFIGAAPDSTNIASILTRFCHEMKRRFGVSLDVPEDYADLVKDWADFLEESVSNTGGVDSKLVVLIDGVDLLEDKYNGRAMDWLPAEIPEGVVIVLSGVESGSCVGILRKCKPAPVEVTVGAMDMWDKAEMVRRTLAKHRKTLDESPFNNQLKLLLTKKEANNPLYLHLACEELRVFGVFEEVTTFLKKMPTTIPILLQEILTRMETEHGIEVLATSLSLLSLVRSGLQEHELSSVLSLFFTEKDPEVESILPPMVISRLLRSLRTFLQPTGEGNASFLTLAHKEIEKAVYSRYMKGAASSQERKFHELLAKYFKSEADPSGDGLYKGNNARAYSELPFHLVAAGAWKELEEILCNIYFVVAKCQMGLASQLLEDFTPTLTGLSSGKAREVAKFMQQPKVQAFKSFVSRNLHVLTNHPTLALQQALNEPSTSVVTRAAQDVLQDSPQPVIRWVNKPEEADPCYMNISSHSGAVTCVTVSQDGSLFAAGFNNCVVKLYEVATGKERHSFIGHAAGITGVCFVGSHGLCSASHDCSLSLWDIKGGYRIATMKGHNRSVHDCASNPSGNLVVSVSWDATIKVWGGREGERVATLKTADTNNTPINCVSFHPEGQLIVVGSWDAKLKIWDTFNKKKLKILKGHKTAIQACTYAPSGRHIVSAALDGEVKIWSTRSGSAMGSLVGHHSPVNSIAFTPNGQYLVTASGDKVLKVWSGSLGQPILSMGCAKLGFAHCLAFDPVTQSVRVGYHDGHVRNFNVQTGVELFAVKVHEAEVVGVAYHDKVHMSASADATVKIWNPSVLPKYIDLIGHKAPITCAVWDKNGFASASEDLTILIWPHQALDYAKASRDLMKSGKVGVNPIATLHGHTAKISSIAFASGGLKMVTASHDRSLIVWDTLGYKQMQVIPACHKDWINTCTFSDTSTDILVTGSNDFTLKVWDLKTGTEKTTFKGHTSSINSVAFSQGCIVSAAFDGSVKVWTHKGIEITTLHCHKQRVNACAVNIPSKLNTSSSKWADIATEEDYAEEVKNMQLEEISVITASDDGTVGVWKPFVPNEITALVGHSDRVLSVVTTFNNQFVSSSLDGSIRLWSPNLTVEPGKASLGSSSLKGHTGPVTSCVMSADGSYAISGGRDGCFIVWLIKRDGEKEREETKLERLYGVRVSEKAVSSICFLTVDQRSKAASIAVGKDDGVISIYRFSPVDYPTKDSTIAAGLLMGDHPIPKLALTSDGNTIIAGSWSNRIAAVSVSNKRITTQLDAHKGWVMDLTAVKEKGSSVVYSIGLDKVLYRWPLPAKQGPTRKPITVSNASRYTLPMDEGEREHAWLLALCEIDSSRLAIADSRGRILLWNKDTKTVELTKKVHQKAINTLAMVGGNLITGSDDCTIKVWKLVSKQPESSITLKQIGHFYCQSCVTATSGVRSTEKNQLPLFVVGDSLGHVTLLQWHQ